MLYSAAGCSSPTLPAKADLQEAHVRLCDLEAPLPEVSPAAIGERPHGGNLARTGWFCCQASLMVEVKGVGGLNLVHIHTHTPSLGRYQRTATKLPVGEPASALNHASFKPIKGNQQSVKCAVTCALLPSRADESRPL